MGSAPGIAFVLAAMDDRRARLEAAGPTTAHLCHFLDTYRRTTEAVDVAVEQARFEDPDWVREWDVGFAGLYLRALDAHLGAHVDARSGALLDDGPPVPRPWQLAFDAPPALHPLLHVLLGINAHVNYDLPQALLAVIPDEDFADPRVVARRRRDHERIDAVLGSRVAAEDRALAGASARSAVDRLLQPLNRLSSKRFLREARTKVWLNAVELQRARLLGTEAYAARLGELEVLSAARIADLLAPGQVLLRLAVAGFGVVLPPPAGTGRAAAVSSPGPG